MLEPSWAPARTRETPDPDATRTEHTRFVEFLVEELIAASALQILTPEHSLAAPYVATLPDPFRQYVEVVDTSRSHDRCMAFLEPFTAEFGLRIEGRSVRHSAVDFSDPLFIHIACILRNVERLVVGIEHHAAVNFHVPLLRESLREVRLRAARPATREAMAVLESVLSTYALTDVVGVTLRRSESRQHAERLAAILKDRDYEEFAYAAYNLGIPARARRALRSMRTIAARIVAKPMWASILDLAMRGISIAKRIPLPTSRDMQTLLDHQEYLPPVFDFGDAHREAFRRWSEEFMGRTDGPN